MKALNWSTLSRHTASVSSRPLRCCSSERASASSPSRRPAGWPPSPASDPAPEMPEVRSWAEIDEASARQNLRGRRGSSWTPPRSGVLVKNRTSSSRRRQVCSPPAHDWIGGAVLWQRSIPPHSTGKFRFSCGTNKICTVLLN
jgi:hypothetical protein